MFFGGVFFLCKDSTKIVSYEYEIHYLAISTVPIKVLPPIIFITHILQFKKWKTICRQIIKPTL